jgi:hypothetical protein
LRASLRSGATDTGLSLLPPFNDGDARGGASWTALAPRLVDRPFLRSEGVNATLAPPRLAAPWLVEQSRELVAVFHRFYRAIIDAKGAVAARSTRQIGEPYESVAEAEGDRDPLPLSRFDCVLAADGKLRVIELNPVGVCTLHLRSISYLGRALERAAVADRVAPGALSAAAAAVDRVSTLKTDSIRRFVESTLARPPARPRLALTLLPGMHRGSLVFWRAELSRAGFDVVTCTPEEVVITTRGATVRGAVIDCLWCDFTVYLGFQQQRYEQTRFTSKVGDFSRASELAVRLLSNPTLCALLADRALTMLSPARSYRAISKALLASVDRHEPDVVISDSDRAFLREHVARTYDDIARQNGALTYEQAKLARETLVLKPCRFGGSHGVTLGRDLAADAWTKRLDDIWTDPEWILQELSEPLRDGPMGDGQQQRPRLSFGLFDYGGTLGGLLVRSADEMIVSARSALVFPALWPAS